jgi:ketosteroid isomerase-like protein
MKFDGAMAPDTALVPVVGAGLGYRITSDLSLQLAARNHMTQMRDARTRADNWVTAERDHRWLVQAGLSFAIGRQPAWSDPPPTPERQAFEASFHPAIVVNLARWLSAVEAADSAGLARTISLAAALIEPNDGYHIGADAVREFWTRPAGARPVIEIQQNTVRVSGNVAYVLASISPAGPPASRAGQRSDLLVTVLERERDLWRIRMQAILSDLADRDAP